MNSEPDRQDDRPRNRLPGFLLRSLTELVVIVVGVLIALGVDAAMQRAEDRALERQYLVSLREDLSPAFDTRTPSEPSADVPGDYPELDPILRIMEDETARLTDTLEFVWALGGLMFTRTPLPDRSTFEDLLSTGNLRLLRNDELRRDIIDFYEFREHIDPIRSGMVEFGFFEAPDVVRELIDPVVWAKVTEVGHRRVWRGPREADRAALPRAELATAVDADTFRASQAFRNLIGRQMEQRALMAALYHSGTGSGTTAAQLVERIDRELLRFE